MKTEAPNVNIKDMFRHEAGFDSDSVSKMLQIRG